MHDRLARTSRDLWPALAVGTATFLGMLASLGWPLVTWDEGYTIEREERVRQWFDRLVTPRGLDTRQRLFGEQGIHDFWRFAREEPDGHPPFYAILGLAGWLVAPNWLPAIEAYRLGPAALFSFTGGVMYLFMARRFGRLAAVAAAGSWVLMPRVFAHAHLASYDIPLACLWFLAVASFWKARENWSVSPRAGRGWSVIFALVLALAAATKFTGWLIPLPLLAWSVASGLTRLRRDGGGALKHLLPLAVVALPLLVAAPQILRDMRAVARIEQALPKPTAQDGQERAKLAAAFMRARESSRLPSVLLFLPCAIWLVATFVPRRLGIEDRGPRTEERGPRTEDREPKTEDREPRTEEREPIIESSVLGSRSSVFGPRSLIDTWAAAIALGPVLTIALIPNWWHHPIRGIAIFLWSNLSRRETTFIPTLFFGDTYPFALPWYNTLAWVVLTVPPLVLLLILFGLLSLAGRKEDRGTRNEEREPKAEGRGSVSGFRASVLGPRSSFLVPRSSVFGPRSLTWVLALNAATLLVVRALPGAPGHDGERQLLGSFPFLACLAGTGAEALRRWLARGLRTALADWLARGLVAGSLVWSAVALWHYRAGPLSYYTELVGGLGGAAALGMEPTYYWDALDGDLVDWLNTNTGPSEKVLFCNYPTSLFYLVQWGRLRVPIRPDEPGRTRWYVLQNRPGLFAEKPWDRWLAEHGRAAMTRELDGTPLIWVFPIEEYEKAIRETRPATESAAGP